jgi:hypothetical protein
VHEQRPAAVGDEIATAVPARCAIDFGDDDGSTLPGKSLGDATTNPTSAAGDDGDLILQKHSNLFPVTGV